LNIYGSRFAPSFFKSKEFLCFTNAGAQAKVSSIPANSWFGDYDKLTMSGILFEEVFGSRLEDIKQQVVYIGDSPNDESMFSYFPNAVGVANVMQFEGKMDHYPAWVTHREGGYGFAEMVDGLLS
jgi:3-deoxy-D-manno-octulosonate 8-phosphate phosphatase KdsC-like HAD superfamily phosphatase